jgi:hypothetical protein
MTGATATQQAGALVDAQASSRAALTEAAIEVALAQIEAFDGWYHDGQVATLAASIAGTVQAAQRQTAALTSAYLGQVLTLLTGKRAPSIGPIDVTSLRSVPPQVVYERLGETYRYERSKGVLDNLARRRVEQRMRAQVSTDTSLAMRGQARKLFDARRITGYRRVIHPELSKSGTCGLCIAASDRIYSRSDLLPIHAHCECEVMPVVGDQDPGRSLNRDDLDQLYAAAGSTGRQDLSHVRYVVHHNGEVGPVLGVEGQHWRGPAVVAKAA